MRQECRAGAGQRPLHPTVLNSDDLAAGISKLAMPRFYRRGTGRGPSTEFTSIRLLPETDRSAQKAYGSESVADEHKRKMEKQLLRGAAFTHIRALLQRQNFIQR